MTSWKNGWNGYLLLSTKIFLAPSKTRIVVLNQNDFYKIGEMFSKVISIITKLIIW